MTRAAGIGCATASQSRGLAADCKGKPQGNPFERRTSALRSAFNLRQIDPRTGSVGDREPCRGAFGSKKVRLNFLSSGTLRIVASIEEPTAIRAIPARRHPCLAHFEKLGALEKAHYRPAPRASPAEAA